MTDARGPLDVHSLEARARAVLDPVAFDYIAGGTGREVTVRDNVDAWARLRLRPRVLRDVSSISTETTVAGITLPSPILIAPTAMHGFVCAERELATARAAERAATTYVVSMAATTSLEDIAAAAPGGRRWMQLYVQRDRGLARAVCERARAAGYEALVVTVDSPVTTLHARVHAGNFAVPTGMTLPNLASGSDDPDLFALVADYDPTVTFADLATFAEWAGDLPLLVKGVLRGDDARRCLDAGAAGVIVSNHGGREVDGAIATADALREVVDAVADRADVLVDGGVRDGNDVLKALALGARAVLLGRSVVWALAIGGEDGVAELLGSVHAELRRLLALCGVPSVADVPADLVERR